MKNKKILSALLPLRCAIFILVFVLGAKLVNKELDEISNWWSIVASVVNIVTIALLCFVTKKKGTNYSGLINLKKRNTSVKLVCLISLLIISVGMLGMYLAGFICYGVIPYAAPMMIAPIPLWAAIINTVVLPLSTVFAEDGLYLGCGVNQIKNKYAAIIIPALFFALQHSFIPTLFDVK